MSEYIEVVWETTVIETHRGVVNLDTLPVSVREAWAQGQILTSEDCSAHEAHQDLMEWIEATENKSWHKAVTDREVIMVAHVATQNTEGESS